MGVATVEFLEGDDVGDVVGREEALDPEEDVELDKPAHESAPRSNPTGLHRLVKKV
jgi:hypothetical protein